MKRIKRTSIITCTGRRRREQHWKRSRRRGIRRKRRRRRRQRRRNRSSRRSSSRWRRRERRKQKKEEEEEEEAEEDAADGTEFSRKMKNNRTTTLVQGLKLDFPNDMLLCAHKQKAWTHVAIILVIRHSYASGMKKRILIKRTACRINTHYHMYKRIWDNIQNQLVHHFHREWHPWHGHDHM